MAGLKLLNGSDIDIGDGLIRLQQIVGFLRIGLFYAHRNLLCGVFTITPY